MVSESNDPEIPGKTPAQKRQETMSRKKLQEQAELRELEGRSKGKLWCSVFLANTNNLKCQSVQRKAMTKALQEPGVFLSMIFGQILLLHIYNQLGRRKNARCRQPLFWSRTTPPKKKKARDLADQWYVCDNHSTRTRSLSGVLKKRQRDCNEASREKKKSFHFSV